jgi:hypothetical protein
MARALAIKDTRPPPDMLDCSSYLLFHRKKLTRHVRMATGLWESKPPLSLAHFHGPELNSIHLLR